MNPLQAISPIDGRYRSRTQDLSGYFSEEALIGYRIKVEVEYFIALCELPLPQLADVDHQLFPKLRAIYKDFSLKDAEKVKSIEAVTNHDVKAVEYFLKDKFDEVGLSAYKEFIHFGLTSQDINNTAIPLSLKDAVKRIYFPTLNELISKLEDLALRWENIPMLARTHGQPASPTRLGKEIKVFVVRLNEQLARLKSTPIAAKFGGATGNFNAHHITYPETDWLKFGHNFVENILGLKHSYPTTQIEHYDHLAGIFDGMRRINTIIKDLNRDIWTYISMDYFKQKIKEGEVGSSTMPHKVNPIDFENSEGNIGMANAIFDYLSNKLPVSRLQRDLTDSTVLRNIGVPVGHTMIAFKATLKGLDKLVLNEPKINADLDNNWAVVAEAVQTILRREAYENPYEALKDLTRTNEEINKESMAEFIDGLKVSEEVKQELKNITPRNYTGI